MTERPIAEYRETQTLRKRHFELYPGGRLCIRSRQPLGETSELNVNLGAIGVERNRFWVKDPSWDMWFLGIIFGSPFLAYALFLMGFQHIWVFCLPLGCLVVCVAVLFMFKRRIEIAAFMTTAGTPGFEVGQFGTSHEEFQAFVNAVELQIKKNQMKSPNQALDATSEPAPGADSSSHQG